MPKLIFGKVSNKILYKNIAQLSLKVAMHLVVYVYLGGIPVTVPGPKGGYYTAERAPGELGRGEGNPPDPPQSSGIKIIVL